MHAVIEVCGHDGGHGGADGGRWNRVGGESRRVGVDELDWRGTDRPERLEFVDHKFDRIGAAPLPSSQQPLSRRARRPALRRALCGARPLAPAASKTEAWESERGGGSSVAEPLVRERRITWSEIA